MLLNRVCHQSRSTNRAFLTHLDLCQCWRRKLQGGLIPAGPRAQLEPSFHIEGSWAQVTLVSQGLNKVPQVGGLTPIGMSVSWSWRLQVEAKVFAGHTPFKASGGHLPPPATYRVRRLSLAYLGLWTVTPTSASDLTGLPSPLASMSLCVSS